MYVNIMTVIAHKMVMMMTDLRFLDFEKLSHTRKKNIAIATVVILLTYQSGVSFVLYNNSNNIIMHAIIILCAFYTV